MSGTVLQAASHFFQSWRIGRRHSPPASQSDLRSDSRACDAHCADELQRLYRLRLNVKESAAPALRRFVVSLCGEALAFMRFAPGPVNGRIAVCLCLNRHAVAQDLQLALGALPNVELVEGVDT